MKRSLATVVVFGISLGAFPPAAPAAEEKPAAEAPAPAAAEAKAAEPAGDAEALWKQIENPQAIQASPQASSGEAKVRASLVRNAARSQEAAKQRAELAKTFIERYPDHEKKVDAMYIRAESLARSGERGEAFVKAANAFVEAAPKDPRAPIVLSNLAQIQQGEADRAETLRRLMKEYPDSAAAKRAKAALRQSEGVGKPFELSFTDAISGKSVSMADLKGKVVVVDFWATWCGPCVAEMPEMKKLYAEYKDKGVEFIGVSLDAPEEKGGLKKLKDFVAEKEITWPQYYQGKGWEGEFSRGWGINSIPAVFVIDADGKLHSTRARGQLGTMIPELLKKAGKEVSLR